MESTLTKLSKLSTVIFVTFVAVMELCAQYDETQGAKLLRMDVPQIEEKANAGDHFAQGLLGIFYRTGELGLPVDLDKSLEWTQKSIETQHPIGLANMGSLEMEKRNIAQANYYYQEAFMNSQLLRWAEDGDPVACFCMGVIYSESNPKDYAKAMQYFLVGAEKGFAASQAQLGTMYFVGMGGGADAEKAIHWSRISIERKSAMGFFNLGIAYSLGQGVEKDMALAFEYLKTSAEQGFAQAQLTLGMKYVKAHGTEQDYLEALRWFKRALTNGMVEAKGPLMKYSIFVSEDELKSVLGEEHFEPKTQVASNYLLPEDERLDENEVKALQERDFEKDFVAFTFDIPKIEDVKVRPGELKEYEAIGRPSRSPYVQGKIEEATRAVLVEKDYSLAEKLLRNLALQGDAVAQRSLGELYFDAEGTRKPDYKVAYEWLEKAAVQGDVLAQRYVGMMFFIGNGPTTDYNMAKEWLTKAAKQGDSEARRQLDIFNRVME
jgi:TPR repeat protein